MKEFSRFIQALICFIVLLVLLGGFYVEFIIGKRPCTLCLLTRVCMMGICTALLMNLRLGFALRHTALAYIFALLGCCTSLKQLSFHVCGSLFPPPSSEMLGLQLWSWAFIVFMCTLLGLSLLFFVSNVGDKIKSKGGGFSCFCLIFLILILIVNLVIAAKLCHFGSGCDF